MKHERILRGPRRENAHNAAPGQAAPFTVGTVEQELEDHIRLKIGALLNNLRGTKFRGTDE